MKLPVPTLGLIGYAFAAGLALGALGGWRVTTWSNQGQELKAVKSALAQSQAAQTAIISDLKRQIERGSVSSSSYQAEIARLRARPVPARVIRLCPDPPQVPAPRESPAATGPDAGTPPRGMVPGGAGADIGGSLYALADRADELLAQCRALQSLAR